MTFTEGSCRRLPSNKKNKTWKDDGVLAIRVVYATLYNNAGKSIGRTAFSAPLLPGSNLTIGGKEIEVDSCISKDEYLAYITSTAKPANAEPKPKPVPVPTQPLLTQKPKMSLQAQMKAQ